MGADGRSREVMVRSAVANSLGQPWYPAVADPTRLARIAGPLRPITACVRQSGV